MNTAEQQESLATAGENAAAGEQQATTSTESAAGEQQNSTQGDGSEQQGNAGEQSRAKAKGGFQKRIDTLTREREFWRAEALRGAPQATQQTSTAQQTDQTAAAATDEKPKPGDFDNHADFVEAVTDWKVDQKLKARETKQAAERAQAEQQTAVSSYQSREQEFANSVEDFEEVVSSVDFTVTKAVVNEIIHGENGPALKYYLAQNPDEAERLNKLTPTALAREVGRLEVSKFTKTAGGKRTTAAPVSRAPEPPTPATRSASTSEKQIEDMSPAEYRAYRAKKFPNLY